MVDFPWLNARFSGDKYLKSHPRDGRKKSLDLLALEPRHRRLSSCAKGSRPWMSSRLAKHGIGRTAEGIGK